MQTFIDFNTALLELMVASSSLLTVCVWFYLVFCAGFATGCMYLQVKGLIDWETEND